MGKSGIGDGVVLVNVCGIISEELNIAEPISVTLSPLQMVAEDGVTDAGKGGSMCTMLV